MEIHPKQRPAPSAPDSGAPREVFDPTRPLREDLTRRVEVQRREADALEFSGRAQAFAQGAAPQETPERAALVARLKAEVDAGTLATPERAARSAARILGG